MGAAEEILFKPVPRYPKSHYKKHGRLHKDFRPPLQHLALVEDLDEFSEDQTDDELRIVASELHRFHLHQSREDYLCFLEFCFMDPVTRKMFEPQWFHEDWVESFTNNRRTIVIAPRGHGKTSVVLPYIIWRLGKNPDLRVKIVCADDDTAKKRLKALKKTIESNPRVREVFPGLIADKKAGWTEHSIFVERSIIDIEPSVEAKGISSSITGARVDLVVADDIVSLQNSIVKPAGRKAVIESWENDWMNLVHDDSQIIYICTLYHREDNSHKVMKSGVYKKLFYAIDQYFGSMWPDKILESSLRDKRSTMSPSAWARGYKNEPMADSDRIVQEAWIKYIEITETVEEMIAAGWIFFSSYDVATKKGNKNDFFASVCGAVHPLSKSVRIVDAWHGKLTKKQQALMIYREYIRYHPSKVFVEIVGNEALDQRLLEDYPELLGVLETITPHNSKGQRLDAVTPFLENDHVRFASHLDPDNPKFKERRGNVVFELVEFPADNDDLADAFSQLLDGIRKYHLDQYQWLKDNQEVEVISFGGR